jgi:tetratricopeptide (TPR) repeat protein
MPSLQGDLTRLAEGGFDAVDCPYCQTACAIEPDLVALFVVEGMLLHLDRGGGPDSLHEANLRIQSLFESLGTPEFSVERTPHLDEFKIRLSARVRATAERFAFQGFNLPDLDACAEQWRGLQGEVLAALVSGSFGLVRGFGLHAAREDGQVADFEETFAVLKDMVADLTTRWAILAPRLTNETPLEEVLTRLVDTSTAMAFVADGIFDRLSQLRTILRKADPQQRELDVWYHFEAVQASIYAALATKNPNMTDWALVFLRMRMAVELADRQGIWRGRLRIGRRRLSATVDLQAAWDATGAVLSSLFRSPALDEVAMRTQVKALATASEELGGEDLMHSVMRGGLLAAPTGVDGVATEGGPSASPTAMAEAALGFARAHPDHSILGFLGMWRNVPWMDDAAALEELISALEKGVGDDPNQRALLLAWFGEAMKRLAEPSRALARMGRRPHPWETELGANARRALWVERSNALRLTEQTAEALIIAEEVIEILEDEPAAGAADTMTAWLNAGILLREVGRHDEAVGRFSNALRAAPMARRWAVLHSLAVCLIEMGMAPQAADAFAEARALVGGEDRREHGPGLLLSEVAARWQAGQKATAKELFANLEDPLDLPSSVVGPYVTTLGALTPPGAARESKRDLIATQVARLVSMADAAEVAGDFLGASHALRAAAVASHTFGLPGADQFWIRTATLALSEGRTPDPFTAVELARIAALDDDPDVLENALSLIPLAVAGKARGIELSGATVGALSTLDSGFARLLEALLQQGWPAEIAQFAAELRRNAHRKANRRAHSGKDLLAPREFVAEKGAGVAPCLVLEWCDLSGGGLAAIATKVSPDQFAPAFLKAPQDVDLFELARRVGARLDRWQSGRTGEPFDHADWPAYCNWLLEQLEAQGASARHLVVIDHPVLGALPSHVALGPHWTVSYAADWEAVADAVASSTQTRPIHSFGVACVPRSNEVPMVRAALCASAEQSQRAAEAAGLKTWAVDPGSADAPVVMALLAEMDAVKVICHGQVSAEDQEVVLLLDFEGRSPPGNTFAEALQGAAGHRLGGRALSSIAASQNVVFLAACNGGRIAIGGLDERHSIASSLLTAGARSVVGARWTLDIELGLPVLDAALELFIAGEPLAHALVNAAEAAIAAGTPKWQAYAFTIEGAWQ